MRPWLLDRRAPNPEPPNSHICDGELAQHIYFTPPGEETRYLRTLAEDSNR